MACATFSPRNGRRSVRELVQRISSSRSLPQLTTPLTLPGTRQSVAEGEVRGRSDQRDQPRARQTALDTERLNSDFGPRQNISNRPATDALPLGVHYLQHQQQARNSTSAESNIREQQCTTVEEELGGRFPSMFNRTQMPSASGDEPPRMVLRESVVAMPSQQGRGCRVSTRYTPYSYQPHRGASRMSRQSSVRPRFESPKVFMRNVFLIDAGESKVPRGSFRQDLYDNGCVEEVERAFENVLPVGIPSPR